jgi:hypothetical protein
MLPMRAPSQINNNTTKSSIIHIPILHFSLSVDPV